VKKRIYSVVYMFLLTLVFASMVSAVKLASEDKIRQYQQMKLQRIILGVLNIPGVEAADAPTLDRVFRERVKPLDLKGRTVYLGYAEDGSTLSGYAFPVSGSGFWGPVYGMAAVDPQVERIIGLAFYRHSETPGLGARITEDWFTSQFKKLRLRPMQGDRKIFTLKAPGTGRGPDELDAVTGATGTSRAVEAFLNRDLDRFLRDLKGPPAQRS